MAEPICEDEGLLQEWKPLTELLQQIPLKIQRGLFSQNLSLTCLDVVPEYFALGTNLGFVYWYCRPTGDLQRLRFENCHCSVTCIKIRQFVDYMVAAGTDQGTVIVFQIPKIEPGSTPDQIKSKQKQIERFTIKDLHQAPVMSIEWHSNEIKVFSGDKIGCVVLTEINLNLHISKSAELLNEQFEIVQLSHCQHILLVSTVYRSILCDSSDNWKVRQIGTKERKILGKFGATLCKFQHGLVLYASRPGHRLWLSDNNGVVQQTLIFKSAIQSNAPKIQLINPIDKKEPYDTSFGKVIQFGDNKLITYNSETLYILHPGAVSVVSVLNSARKILDLSVNENEIFILEGERSLLRISSLPDKYSSDLLYQPVSRRTSFSLDDFAAKIKDTAVESIKKITKDLIQANEQASPNSPPALADEAVELPPTIPLPAGLIPAIFAGENIEIQSFTSDPNFSTSANTCANSDKLQLYTNKVNSFSSNHDWPEEVITRPLRKRHNKKSKPVQQNPTLLAGSESDTTSNASGDRLVCGIANDLSLSEESAFSQSQSSFSVLRDISSLLPMPKNMQKNCETGNEELMITSDAKSQTSLDTCESVSERLLLTSEAFQEEQEKTFARLANQSLFDSFNSEKTDNMSISLSMTQSSSFSSKISEYVPSPSYTSENSGIASRTKSAESQNTDNMEKESQSKGNWKWSNDLIEENSSQEENISRSASSLSDRNSQGNRLNPNYTGKSESENSTADGLTEDSNGFSTGEVHVLGKTKTSSSENRCCENGFSNTVLMNETSNTQKGIPSPTIQNPVNELASHSFDRNSSESPHSVNSYLKSSQSRNLLNSELEQARIQLELESKNEDEEKSLHEFETEAFLPVEPLSYGPPSGSSLLGSQPSSDFSSIPAPNISLLVVQDSFDHWPQYKTPGKITSLAACKNYIVCTDIRNKVYYSHVEGLGLSWTLLDYKASLVRVSNDGSVVWLLNKNTVSALLNPFLNCPKSETVVEIAEDITTCAIDNVNNDGVLITSSGKVINYTECMTGSTEKEVWCDFGVVDVACSGGRILVVSNDYRVLCKLPEEEQFREVKTLKPVTSLALGPENFLWVVDEANNIFFSDDYVTDEPNWWQIQISDYIFQNVSKPFQNVCDKIKLTELKSNMKAKTSLITVNEESVWIVNKFGSSVCTNKTGFTGYLWSKVSSIKPLPDIQWQTLCAGGVFEDNGRVWLLSLDGNIFCTTPNEAVFQSIPVPFEENILCITSSLDTCWILLESGRILSRLGLSTSNFFGTSWKEMKSPQIDNLKFVWISCGSDVAWACDIHGRTFITIGSPHRMATLDPTWVEVEGRPRNVQFQKVFVGSQLYMVWAIDTSRNLYVREGIFPHYQIGTSWVYVCGIEAVHVTLSSAHVWALARDGNIYRRCGVSESNFIGDYWRNVPGNLKMLSSTFSNELWGINHENNILRLSCNLKILREENINSNMENSPSKDDTSWEMVH